MTVASQLCLTLQALAERTWGRMFKNQSTGITLREDGITALNLQDLATFNQATLTVVDFSPWLESRETGADWEWWFVDQQGAFGAAVQAKSLSDCTYGIDFVPNGGTTQIDRLMQYCKTNRVHPQYVFYNFWSKPQAATWPCPTISHHEPLWGCTIADGHAVYRLHKSGRSTLPHILPISLPWHCLTCCPPAQSPGVGQAAYAVASVLHNVGTAEAVDSDNFPVLSAGLPERVRTALAASATPDRNPRDALAAWGDFPPRALVLIQDET
jgi:hypothetical protein